MRRVTFASGSTAPSFALRLIRAETNWGRANQTEREWEGDAVVPGLRINDRTGAAQQLFDQWNSPQPKITVRPVNRIVSRWYPAFSHQVVRNGLAWRNGCSDSRMPQNSIA